MDFLDQVVHLVEARFPLVRLERSDATFSLRINGYWAPLENLYRLTLQQPDHMARNVERWITELLRAAEGSPDQSAPFEQVKDRILPVVVAGGAQIGGPLGAAVLSQNILDGLAVAYAIDSDQFIAYIPRRLFDQWGISLDSLHELAIQNLVVRSESIQAHAGQDEDGRISLILVQTMDGYDASRILLPSLHERLRKHLGSPFVAGIPNRNILVCFRDDPQTVARMRKQIRQDYQTMPHQVTDRLFLITADGIAPYSQQPT